MECTAGKCGGRSGLPMSREQAILSGAGWSALTIGVYGASKWLARQSSSRWAAPMISAPLLLLALAWILHIDGSGYLAGTHWLVALFAPTTVAFALPVYQQRDLIR